MCETTLTEDKTVLMSTIKRINMSGLVGRTPVMATSGFLSTKVQAVKQ